MTDTMLVREYRALLKAQVASDDAQTVCACCGHRARNDQKDFNRWMALAIRAIYTDIGEGKPFHAATFLQKACPEATRDHGVSLLRHWGLLEEVERPDNTDKKLKGSRGLSGFYRLTDDGYFFAAGETRIHKTIRKQFGEADFTVDRASRLIHIDDALEAILKVKGGNVVADGTTV